MSKPKPFGYYVIKAVRVTGWLLLVLMVLYTLTGWALAETLGLHRVIGERLAEDLHYRWKLDWPLAAIVLAHAGGATYLAMRRWGWIRSGRKS